MIVAGITAAWWRWPDWNGTNEGCQEAQEAQDGYKMLYRDDYRVVRLHSSVIDYCKYHDILLDTLIADQSEIPCSVGASGA